MFVHQTQFTIGEYWVLHAIETWNCTITKGFELDHIQNSFDVIKCTYDNEIERCGAIIGTMIDEIHERYATANTIIDNKVLLFYFLLKKNMVYLFVHFGLMWVVMVGLIYKTKNPTCVTISWIVKGDIFFFFFPFIKHKYIYFNEIEAFYSINPMIAQDQFCIICIFILFYCM